MLGLVCASSFEHLVLSNIAIGAGMASAMAGASNYLADISMPRNRAQTTAPLLQSALIGFAIGPAVGGVLCQYTGLSLPFVACAAGLAASSVTGALLLPETLDEASVRAVRAAATKQQQQQQQHQQQPEAAIAVPDADASATEEVSVQRLLARPALQGLFATILTNGVGQGAMPITMVLYAVETVGMSSAAIGTMLTANVLVMVLASVPASRLSDRVADRKSVMLPALLGGTAFFAAQPLASSALVYALLVGSSGFCQALAMPNTSPLILDHAEPSERARALALRQMVQDGGALLGAAGAGAVAGAYGVPTAIEMVAALQVASTIFCALRSPWKHSNRD
jgi:MFS family permease